MKLVLLATVLIAVLGAAISLRTGVKKSSNGDVSRKADPAIYPEMRELAFHGSRAAFDITGTYSKNQPWGVVMETGYPEGSATLVALADGSASIYLSSGGGTIGGIADEKIRDAAQQVVQIASQFQPEMKLTSIFPVPRRGETIFYVLTDGGVFTASASEEKLGNNRHRFSPLFHARHGVITEFRLLDERRENQL